MVGYAASSNSEASVSVSPELRIVPCGGNGEKLKATVLISPLPSTKIDGAVSLNSWPTSFAGLLERAEWSFNVNLQVIPRPVVCTTDTVPIPCPDPGAYLRLDHAPLKASAAFTEKRLADLTQLWRRSIAPGGSTSDVWQTLETKLAASSSPTIHLGGIANGTTSVTIDKTKLGEQGQLKPPEGNQPDIIDSVIAVPHANLAIALEQKRADELLDSIAKVDDSPALVTGQRPTEPPSWEQLAPKLGLDPKLVGPENAEDAKKKLYQDTVGAYRAERLRTLQASVKPARDKAYELYKNAGTALDKCTCSVTEAPRKGWSGCFPAQLTDAETREAVIQKNDAVEEHATWPQHVDNPSDNSGREEHDPAGLAFFTIQSTPSLARAFLLAVDLELVAPESLEQGTHFAYLTVSLDETSAAEELVTLCKIELRKSATGKRFWHFWPTTMAELEFWLSGRKDLCGEALSQHDAVMVMASGWDLDHPNSLPRFDLTCLDLTAAVTSNRQRRLAKEDSEIEPKDDKRKENHVPSWSDLDSGATLTSAGLTLLQRSAQADVIAKLAAREVKTAGTPAGVAVTKGSDGCTRVVLDAEDLTIGARLVVGRRDDDDFTDWSPLMGRTIRFGTTGATDINKAVVEDVLADLVGIAGSPARIALDSAFTTMGNRVLPLPVGGTDRKSEIIVDEAYATWDGGPMGVDTGNRDDFKDVVEDALAFGRQLSLPEKGVDRPHALRYGHPYRMAMLPVFSGGMSLPMAEFPQDTTDACAADPLIALLHYPPSYRRGGTGDVVSPYVRMLRHARIAPPIALLPWGHATRVNGPVGLEAARDLVVRSLAEGDENTANLRLRARARPGVAQRLLLVPTLTQDEAARHGMLDPQSGIARPRGAYGYVAQDPKTQAFPVTLTRFQKGIGDRKYFLDSRVSGDPAPSRLADLELKGDAVWKPRSAEGATTYFPDPAARYLAIRLRTPGREAGFHVAWYDLGPKAKPYSEPRPVLLTLSRERKGKAPGLPPSGTLPVTRIDPGKKDDIRGTFGRRVFDLEIVLRKGEVFDLDIWWVPDAEALARDFALPQSLGVHLAACERKGFTANFTDMVTALKRRNLHGFAALFEAEHPGKLPVTDLTYVAPGGVAAPSNATLKALARALVALHKTQPLPELASVQRMTLTHATNRPEKTEAPVLAEPGCDDPFPGTELPLPETADTPLPLYARRYAPLGGETVYEALMVAENDGETGLVIGGTVAIDLDLADSLEVWARVIHPDSGLFDDPALGRSPALRQSGTWPTKISGLDPMAFRDASSIFGFEVFADGQVRHADREVLLLRIDDLKPSTKGGTVFLDLLPYFLQSKGPPFGGRVVRRHQFTDGKARVLQVWVNALGRTSDRMATVDRVAFADDPWVDPKRGFGFILGDFVDSAPLPANEQGRTNDKPVRVVMPASIRPLPCDARSTFPVFGKETVRNSTVGPFRRLISERKTKIRFPLGRGWYSSGEDERVGFVLWPPRLLGSSGPAVTAPIPGRGDVALDGFRDVDLGPGGRFVSRRGGDPVRAGRGEERNLFLRGEDFRDLGAPGSDLLYEDDVLMPLEKLAETGVIPEAAGTAATAAVAAADAQPGLPPMRVALVTALPRFDPEREEWYVDLDLRPGQAPEVFVRLGLVRYQPYTDPDRRCSPPVVQWAQPLPDRLLMVSRDGDRGLKVQVRGEAMSRQVERGKDGSLKESGQRGPKMKVTLASETLDAEGRLLRRHLAEYEAMVGPEALDGEDLWEWTALVPLAHLREATKTGPDGRIPDVMLHVEETEAFHPAEYADEPQEPDDAARNDRSAKSGPRYAGRLELKDMLADLGLLAEATGAM